ncbi:glycosyltransferase [Sphingomonas sp.]|uniref:glycosyltransferase n=1 Tax=Sphingomonas sp. TaxID=28214 RepID=UPI001850FFF9|nr:glycosyltransferase [Sphingomonas sp.]MBA3511524.1 glycosyltransferase [Sphingomonas sp.]
MSVPRVSISIVSYNQESYIAEAIESAVAQDYPNLEVVVADDGSTDRTQEIIRQYALQYPNLVIAVLNSRNEGITRNSNKALRACSGEFIAFMGGDDVLLAGKVAAQIDWFLNDPRRVLCGHQVEVFYENGSRSPHPLTRRLLSGRGAEALIRHGPYGATSVMVRTDRVPSYGFDGALPVVSDQLLWVDVIRDDGLFGYIPGTFARYRQHDANVTRDPFANLDEVARYLEIVHERYPPFRRAVRYAITRRLFYDVAVAMLDVGRKSEAREKLLQALRREPWFARAWVRLAQSFA